VHSRILEQYSVDDDPALLQAIEINLKQLDDLGLVTRIR